MMMALYSRGRELVNSRVYATQQARTRDSAARGS